MKRARFILEEGNRMQWLSKSVIKDIQVDGAQNATSIITEVPVIPVTPKTVGEMPDFESLEKKRQFLQEKEAKERLEQEQKEREARMQAEMEQLAQLKEQMLSEAHVQVAQMQEEAQRESEKLKEIAYQEAYAKGEKEGYATGFNEGMEQAKQEGQSIVAIARSNVENLLEESQQYVLDKKNEWTQTSVEMAQMLIQKQFELDETTILSVLEPMWLAIEEPDQLLIIRTHPEHFTVINEEMIRRKAEIPNFRYAILKEQNYTPYQVEVESDEMLLTFNLEEELQQFLEQLKKDEANHEL